MIGPRGGVAGRRSPRPAARPQAGRAALAAVLLALSALACGQPRRGPSLPVEARVSRVDVFLAARTGTTSGVRLDLAGLRLVDAAGGLHELSLEHLSVAADDLARRTALAGGVVPPGTYVELQLDLAGASRLVDGRSLPLHLLAPGEEPPAAPPPDEPGGPLTYPVPVHLEVGRHDAVSIFLEWNVDASLPGGDWFRPALAFALERPQARLGLLYVADAASGTVLAVQRSSGEVVATIKVGDAPRALAISRDRRRLYVANAGDGSVSLVDTRENTAQFTIPVRLGADTADVVVAEDGRRVAVVNTGTDTLSLIDVPNATRLQDLRVGRQPVELAAAPDLRRLFVANALSDDVSVVDLNALDVVATLPVESGPSAIAADRRGREIYVGHRQSPDLLVIDAESLLTNATIYVGGDVTAVLADRRLDRIYVSRATPPEIAVVDRRLAAVTRRIPVSGRIEGLAQPPEGPDLYGAAPELGGLIVVDVILGREQPLLPCGTAPTDVAAVD